MQDSINVKVPKVVVSGVDIHLSGGALCDKDSVICGGRQVITLSREGINCGNVGRGCVDCVCVHDIDVIMEVALADEVLMLIVDLASIPIEVDVSTMAGELGHGQQVSMQVWDE